MLLGILIGLAIGVALGSGSLAQKMRKDKENQEDV